MSDMRIVTAAGVASAVANRPEADGQAWHLPAAGPLTAQQFFDMVAGAAGQPVPVRASVASPALLRVGSLFSALLREMRETTYQFRAPFVIDASKFQAAFGRLEPHPAPRRGAADRRLVPVPLTTEPPRQISANSAAAAAAIRWRRCAQIPQMCTLPGLDRHHAHVAQISGTARAAYARTNH